MNSPLEVLFIAFAEYSFWLEQWLGTRPYNLTLCRSSRKRSGALVQWLKLPFGKSGIGGSSPALVFNFKETKCFFPAHRAHS